MSKLTVSTDDKTVVDTVIVRANGAYLEGLDGAESLDAGLASFPIASEREIRRLAYVLLSRTPLTWSTLSLGTGWSHLGDFGHGPPQHSIDARGVVRLRGLVAGGAAGTLVATLPVGRIPLFKEIFGALGLRDGSTSPEALSLEVLGDGVVQIPYGGTWTWLSLTSVAFSVD